MHPSDVGQRADGPFDADDEPTATTQLLGGGCPAGSAVASTGEMMHVWAVEYPAGPFGELDAGMLREAVLDVYGIGVQPVSG